MSWRELVSLGFVISHCTCAFDRGRIYRRLLQLRGPLAADSVIMEVLHYGCRVRTPVQAVPLVDMIC